MPRFVKRLRVTRLVDDKKYVVTIVEHVRKYTHDRAKDPKRGKGKPLPSMDYDSDGQEDSLYTPVYSVKSCEPAFMHSKSEFLRLSPRKLKNRRAKEINRAKKEQKALIKAVDEVRTQQAQDRLFVPLEQYVGKTAKVDAPPREAKNLKNPIDATAKDKLKTSKMPIAKDVIEVAPVVPRITKEPLTMSKVLKQKTDEDDFDFVDRFLKKYPDSSIPLTRACEKWGLYHSKRKGDFLVFVDDFGLKPEQMDKLEDLSSFIKLLVKKLNRRAPPEALTSRYCTCGECSNFLSYPAWIEGVRSFYTVSEYNSKTAATVKKQQTHRFDPKMMAYREAERANRSMNEQIFKAHFGHGLKGPENKTAGFKEPRYGVPRGFEGAYGNANSSNGAL